MSYWWNFGFEAIKLCAQFLGALFVARMAVQWALNRYKNEKHWERKLQVYTDVLAAIGTMMEILGTWERWEIGGNEPTDELQKEYRNRYWAARQKLHESVGATALLLPVDVSTHLAKLTDVLNKTDKAAGWMEAIGNEWSALYELKKEVVKIGKDDLNLESSSVTYRRKNAIKSSSNA